MAVDPPFSPSLLRYCFEISEMFSERLFSDVNLQSATTIGTQSLSEKFRSDETSVVGIIIIAVFTFEIRNRPRSHAYYFTEQKVRPLIMEANTSSLQLTPKRRRFSTPV